MQPDINVRRAKVSDIPHLVDFQMRLARETENVTLDAEILSKGMMAMFDDPTKGFYNVAEIENEVVGCHMVTYEWSDWRNGMVYWLQSVYVKEQYRKNGVFKFMFSTLKNQIDNDPAIRGLRLYVDKTNVRAQKVYGSMGMNGDHYSVFELMKS
jgi:ribosomal protein S18 acetylase RimI-like enzyme